MKGELGSAFPFIVTYHEMNNFENIIVTCNKNRDEIRKTISAKNNVVYSEFIS